MFTNIWATVKGIFDIVKLWNSLMDWLQSLRDKEAGRQEVKDEVERETTDAQARMDAVPDTTTDAAVRDSLQRGTF